MSRFFCLVLTLAMVGCAQHVTPFAPVTSQPTASNAGASAAKPADSVTAHVQYKNDTLHNSIFTVYWSYAANPIWHVEVQECVKSYSEFDTKVVYNHVKEGPQIKFSAEKAVNDTCLGNPIAHRAVTFRSMIFDPDASFYARYTHPTGWKLCAHGGGNKEVCDDK